MAPLLLERLTSGRMGSGKQIELTSVPILVRFVTGQGRIRGGRREAEHQAQGRGQERG